MKKIFLGLIAITLILITFFQYRNYQRFNPPVDYEYGISDGIDVDYHDATLVTEYFSKAIEIGEFARRKWRNESIDVRFPDQDSEVEMNAAKYYNQLKARTLLLEKKLSNSFNLKKDGFSNEDVQAVEGGVPIILINARVNKDAIVILRIGDQSEHVWKLQERLIEKGYPHQLDGLFGIDTQNALTSYQTDQGIYPSGAMNEEAFALLFLKD